MAAGVPRGLPIGALVAIAFEARLSHRIVAASMGFGNSRIIRDRAVAVPDHQDTLLARPLVGLDPGRSSPYSEESTIRLESIAPSMMRSPFVAVVLAGSLTVQLLLAGAGATCIDPGHGSRPASAGAERHAMAAMDMAMDMPGHDMRPQSEERPANHESPCDQPATPADCQVMAPCAGGFFASSLADLGASDRVPPGAAARPILALSSRTIPPELPPPRA